jgi:hypothetical protein
MRSWWQLGEGSGFSGNELELYRLTCPFCLERGNFALEHRAQKKKANSKKVLNFDTWCCGNCAGYVLVLWSAQEYPGSRGLYSYQVLPWPLKLDAFPEHWPEAVGRYWLQAHRSLGEENWDAAAVMSRSAMQVALREKDAAGKSLKQEIDDLATKGVLPPHMREWAHELRELGNDSAHPDPGQAKTQKDDAKDVIEFLDFMLQYLYNLPHQIEQYRRRRSEPAV